MAARMTTAEKLEKIKADPVLWLGNMVKIIDNEGKEVPFILNRDQRDFIEKMDKYNIILKGRQLGFTTLALGLMLYYAHMNDNTSYMLISYDMDSTNNIFNKLKMMYSTIPEKYRVPEKRNNRGELVLKNGSRISVKVASHKSLGRSFTCQFIHISEMAFFQDDAGKDILVGLEQALAKNPDSRIVIESTANSVGNSYYELFQNAYKGNSKYKAQFFSWHSEAQRIQFKHELDLAEEWYQARNHGKKLLKEDMTPYELQLIEKGCSNRQICWRRYKLQDMTPEAFRQEFPSTPEEAFISTDTGVFSSEILLERYNYLPPEILYQNLKTPLSPDLSRYYGNGFYIYQDVKEGERYYLGVDVGSGLGRKNNDYTSVTVLDSNGEEVCQFYRNDVPTYVMAKLLYDLGLYFNYASILIERQTYGLDLLHRLKKEQGYINVLKTSRFDRTTGRRVFEHGWNSNNTNKTKAVTDLKEAIESGSILVNCKETLDQMRIFREKGGKFGNIEGVNNHDDCVDSLCLALQALKTRKSYV